MRPPRPGLRITREVKRCAHFVGDGAGDVLIALVVALEDALQERQALDMRRAREGLESRLCRGNRLVHVGRGADGYASEWLFRGRVDDVERLRHDWRHPVAVDVELFVVAHRRCPLSNFQVFRENTEGTQVVVPAQFGRNQLFRPLPGDCAVARSLPHAITMPPSMIGPVFSKRSSAKGFMRWSMRPLAIASASTYPAAGAPAKP